jgi:hypothetical protein
MVCDKEQVLQDGRIRLSSHTSAFHGDGGQLKGPRFKLYATLVEEECTKTFIIMRLLDIYKVNTLWDVVNLSAVLISVTKQWEFDKILHMVSTARSVAHTSIRC